MAKKKETKKKRCEAMPVPMHGKYHSLSITLPPLSMVIFKKEGEKA